MVVKGTALVLYTIQDSLLECNSCLYLCSHLGNLSIPTTLFSEYYKFWLHIQVSAFISFGPICFTKAFNTPILGTSQPQFLHLHLFALLGFSLRLSGTVLQFYSPSNSLCTYSSSPIDETVTFSLLVASTLLIHDSHFDSSRFIFVISITGYELPLILEQSLRSSFPSLSFSTFCHGLSLVWNILAYLPFHSSLQADLKAE